jgi:hypothetical protein
LNPAETSTAPVKTNSKEGRKVAWFVARCLLGFAIPWILFYGVFQSLPYLSSGSDIIYRAKLDREFNGSIFPANASARRVLIFGDSRVLTGFIPDQFDGLATADGLNLSSYNSGYPARTAFMPALKEISENKLNTPDILLLTFPWRSTHFNAFRPLPEDHDIVDQLFPFRYLPRDILSFLILSWEHGGVFNFYRNGPLQAAKMIQDRGYYFLADMSHYPNKTLPDSASLTSDMPHKVDLRVADPASDELTELNRIIQEHHMQCYFVPLPLRAGTLAQGPEIDRSFADLLERSTPCKLLGPDYYLYPNHMFSDYIHLNPEGAKIYTEAIYRLLAKKLQEY